VGRLGRADRGALHTLLDTDRVLNVYLRSELGRGVESAEWWGVHDGDEVRAALLAGALAVPFIPHAEDAPRIAETACAVTPPRMLVGPQASVSALHAALRGVLHTREVRDPQPLMTLDRDDLLSAEAVPVRRAQRTDLDALVVAAAAMHREEMGVDPLRIDAAAWRARMLALIDSGWSWVWTEERRVVFKAELSAWTPDVVQIQGVYTDPGRRRHGVAQRGLSAVCRVLLRDVPLCSLYVNHYNETAIRLYERLGFVRAGDFATVFY